MNMILRIALKERSISEAIETYDQFKETELQMILIEA